MNYSKNSLDYIRVQLVVAAMDSLLTVEQSSRIERAAEWGGFDAGMRALARVSDEIAKAQQKKSEDAAYNEGKIISLQSRVESEKARAARALQGLNTIFNAPAHMTHRSHSIMAHGVAEIVLNNETEG